MPQHHDQRDISLTETGRQPGTTGRYDVRIRFASASDAPVLNAATRFRVSTNNLNADEVTKHEIVLTTTGAVAVGSIFWKRFAAMVDSSESPGRAVTHDTRFPAASSSTVTLPTRSADLTWTPTLLEADAWKFTLEAWLEPASPFTMSFIDVVQSNGGMLWGIQVQDSSGSVVYSARLFGSIEPTP